MTTDHAPTGLIGASIRRVEDPVLVAGKGCYVDDIQLPGMSLLSFSAHDVSPRKNNFH